MIDLENVKKSYATGVLLTESTRISMIVWALCLEARELFRRVSTARFIASLAPTEASGSCGSIVICTYTPSPKTLSLKLATGTYPQATKSNATNATICFITLSFYHKIHEFLWHHDFFDNLAAKPFCHALFAKS